MKSIYDVIDEITDPNYKFDQPNAMSDWEKFGFIKKDVKDGDIIKILSFDSVDNTKLKLNCENGLTLYCDLKKDKEFFRIKNIANNIDDIKDWLTTDDGMDFFKNNDCSVMIQKNERTTVGSLLNSHISTKYDEFYKQIKLNEKYYEATVTGKNTGGFIVEIDGVTAFLPGGQAAANKIIDFDTYIGKKINVMVEDYIKEGSTFIVSHKKYLKEIFNYEIN